MSMSISRLTDAEVALALESLDGWERDGDRIVAAWRFDDFVTAFSFMTAVAIHAERLNHHPEWENVYSRVSIALTTHDAGGLSSYDMELAALITAAAERAGAVTG